MTILATHFALVLGAWRVRVRIDIDEPREERPLRRHIRAQRYVGRHHVVR